MRPKKGDHLHVICKSLICLILSRSEAQIQKDQSELGMLSAVTYSEVLEEKLLVQAM